MKQVVLHHIPHLAPSANEGATASESSFFVRDDELERLFS